MLQKPFSPQRYRFSFDSPKQKARKTCLDSMAQFHCLSTFCSMRQTRKRYGIDLNQILFQGQQFLSSLSAFHWKPFIFSQRKVWCTLTDPNDLLFATHLRSHLFYPLVPLVLMYMCSHISNSSKVAPIPIPPLLILQTQNLGVILGFFLFFHVHILSH